MAGERKATGNLGENAVADFLTRSGFIILERNFRFRRLGEIDIIARENGYLCFIEVKCRRSDAFGRPSEAVTRRKQRNIFRLADIYMSIRGLCDERARFDVAEVLVHSSEGGEKYSINYIRDAF